MQKTESHQTTNTGAVDCGLGYAMHHALEEDIHFEKRIQVANAIAEQIWREQQLVSTRMHWNFTFQAFLAGIYVFAGSTLYGLNQFLVQMVLVSLGLAVAYFCLLGVVAAQDQSSRLKRHWANEFCKNPPKEPGDCDITRGAYPQPFSKSEGSRRGRYTSRGVCGALMAMWVGMLVITLVVNFVLPKPHTSNKLVCYLETPASGPTSITCKSGPSSLALH